MIPEEESKKERELILTGKLKHSQSYLVNLTSTTRLKVEGCLVKAVKLKKDILYMTGVKATDCADSKVWTLKSNLSCSS